MLTKIEQALGKPQKKLFFSGQFTKALSPNRATSLGLVVKRTDTFFF